MTPRIGRRRAEERGRLRKREDGLMTYRDFELPCNMACAGLPEGWVIEMHLEKGTRSLGLFPPNGARQDFDVTEATMAEQVLKAIAVAKASYIGSPESKSMPAKPDQPIRKATPKVEGEVSAKTSGLHLD
jgi:hypothetical protein